MDILALFQPIPNCLSKTVLRRLSRVITAMLAMTGRVTMLGLSRWADQGGSYRSVQRLFYTAIPWVQMFWQFFRTHLIEKEGVYLLAGDECLVSKAGKKTYGLDRLFSSLLQRSVPGLSFFALSLISVKARHAFPLCVEQMVRSEEEKAACRARAERKKRAAPSVARRKAGRPKGSHNKSKADVTLCAELQRIQKMIRSVLQITAGFLSLSYLVLDGHFGNQPALCMARQCNLHLISKLRSNTALYLPYEGPYAGRGRRRRFGERVDYQHLPEKYHKATRVEDDIETRVYQAELLHHEFSQALNVVILIKTNLRTQAWAHVALFSSDLTLAYEQLVDYYSLRFQIEFNFRDAKQFWGLEDFMNVTQTAVSNAANLALFMTNVSQVLMGPFRQQDPAFSVLDLKAYYRAQRYFTEAIQMLPQKPDDNIIQCILQQMAALGSIHPVQEPFHAP